MVTLKFNFAGHFSSQQSLLNCVPGAAAQVGLNDIECALERVMFDLGGCEELCQSRQQNLMATEKHDGEGVQ